MAWVKLDDQFYDHEKVLTAGPHAIALHIAGMCWVGGRLTDGRIPKAVLPALIAKAGVPARTVNRLVEVGLWDVTDDGWLIHDWLDWNPSGAQVKAERAAGKERAAKSRAAKDERARAERAANVQGTCSDPSPSPSEGHPPTPRRIRAVDNPPPKPAPYHRPWTPDGLVNPGRRDTGAASA